jgi:hypothetical protein
MQRIATDAKCLSMLLFRDAVPNNKLYDKGWTSHIVSACAYQDIFRA